MVPLGVVLWVAFATPVVSLRRVRRHDNLRIGDAAAQAPLRRDRRTQPKTRSSGSAETLCSRVPAEVVALETAT